MAVRVMSIELLIIELLSLPVWQHDS